MPEVLVDILGRTRARLLALLAVPATTTQVAQLFQVTPGAVSRHLSALQHAAPLDRIPDGRHVWYVQSPLGHALHQQSRTATGPAVMSWVAKASEPSQSIGSLLWSAMVATRDGWSTEIACVPQPQVTYLAPPVAFREGRVMR